MKSGLFITPIFLLLGLAPAFSQKNTETRQLHAFNRIDISGGFEAITLVKGNKEAVTIETDGVKLDQVLTAVSGKALKIAMQNGSYRYGEVRLTITYVDLEEINASGSSDIFAQGTIVGDEFEYNGSGSGDFMATLEIDDLDINISGSGDVKLAGKAENQHFKISGSGDVMAGELLGENALVQISGSGDITVNVSGELKGKVSGSGKIMNRIAK